MTPRNPAELAELLRPGQRVLGIDPGEKILGLALSDPSRTVATPWQGLPRKAFRDVVAAIRELAAAEDVGGIVVGLPVNMDGTQGPKAQAARALGRNLERELGLPVAYWDERLSTVTVTRTLREAAASRSKKAANVDKMAAAFILQGALDRMRQG